MSGANGAVLVVDDDYLIATELTLHLREEGFDVLGPFSTIDAARGAMERQRPDAAFLDINLGDGRTSYELAGELKSLGIPFIFVTGYSSLTIEDRQFEDVELLMKPVDLDAAAREAGRLCSQAG
jgi:two-component SAPR family response regulator